MGSRGKSDGRARVETPRSNPNAAAAKSSARLGQGRSNCSGSFRVIGIYVEGASRRSFFNPRKSGLSTRTRSRPGSGRECFSSARALFPAGPWPSRRGEAVVGSDHKCEMVIRLTFNIETIGLCKTALRGDSRKHRASSLCDQPASSLRRCGDVTGVGVRKSRPNR